MSPPLHEPVRTTQARQGQEGLSCMVGILVDIAHFTVFTAEVAKQNAIWYVFLLRPEMG
jgi:hypothetical protein